MMLKSDADLKKKMTRIWWILIRAVKSLKNFHFNWFLPCKVYNVWPWKCTEELSFMKMKIHANLKKSRLVVSKMTWGIWQIFIRTHESVKIVFFMRSFCQKQKMQELKIYRGFMCNETEEWWKSWRGIDLPFQNWHKQFDEFSLEHQKVSKIYTLMGCFWLKSIIFFS